MNNRSHNQQAYPPLKIVIFTDEPGWHGRVLKTALQEQNAIGHFVSLQQCGIVVSNRQQEILIPECESETIDGVFVRGVAAGSIEAIFSQLSILHFFSMKQIPVMNMGKTIENTVDKAMTSFLLSKAKIPTPTTWLVTSIQKLIALVKKEITYENQLIVKPLYGSQGKGITLIKKTTDIDKLPDLGGVFYLQRFIDNGLDYFCDYRIFVIDNRVVAGMRRISDSFVTNYAQNSTCEPATVTPIMQTLALKAVKTVGAIYAGVDLIQDKHQNWHVLEVNGIPAWKGLQSTTSINIAQWLISSMLSRCRHHHKENPCRTTIKA